MSILNPNKRGRIKFNGGKGTSRERLSKTIARATEYNNQYRHEEGVLRNYARVMQGQVGKLKNAEDWAMAYNELANKRSSISAGNVRRIEKLRNAERIIQAQKVLGTAEEKTAFRRFIRTPNFFSVFYDIEMKVGDEVPLSDTQLIRQVKSDSENRVSSRQYRRLYGWYRSLADRMKIERPNSSLTRAAELLINEMKEKFG